MTTYDGAVGFGSDGIHYPDEDGNLDTTRPLRWVEGTTYRDADDGDELHNDTHHARIASVDPSSLTIHDPGRDSYPVGAHVVSEDAVTYYLADEHGNPIDGRPLRWDIDTQTFETEGT